VSTNELAEKLKAKPASITDMMKKLKPGSWLTTSPTRVFG
jgi:Mn-dependent DtxR family transcriptional regulator